MRINPKYLTPVLAAGAAALAITAAPIAAAAPTPLQQSCVDSGAGTVCQSPGNAQVTADAPIVNYDPYGYDGFLLGGFGYGGHGFGGGYGGYGGHGGGGGHR